MDEAVDRVVGPVSAETLRVAVGVFYEFGELGPKAVFDSIQDELPIEPESVVADAAVRASFFVRVLQTRQSDLVDTGFCRVDDNSLLSTHSKCEEVFGKMPMRTNDSTDALADRLIQGLAGERKPAAHSFHRDEVFDLIAEVIAEHLEPIDGGACSEHEVKPRLLGVVSALATHIGTMLGAASIHAVDPNEILTVIGDSLFKSLDIFYKDHVDACDDKECMAYMREMRREAEKRFRRGRQAN